MCPRFTSRFELRNLNRVALAAGVLFLFLAQSMLQAAGFTAALDKSTIALGETATLSLSFEGAAPEKPPTLPAIPNLQVSYVGQSSQMSIINGAVSSVTTHNFSITPRQIGLFSIPSIIAEVNGQKIASAPLKLTVIKPGSSVSGNAGEQLAFMKLVLPKQEAYVGEIIKAELQLYLGSSVQNFGNFQITSFPAEGFNVGKMAEDHRNRVQVGNSVYTLISVAMIVTPVKSGSFEVGPVGTKLVIELPRTDRRRDPYDPFGMFNRNEQKEITLATEPQTLKVLPLPSGAPPSFKGAVGHYTMTATVGPTNVAVGDPITLRIRIAGQGNLDAVALPDQLGWDDFKTYPPTSKVETTDPLGIDGVKTFEQVVTPQKSDLKTLPPFSFSYFNPDQKRYETLTQPETALTVRPGGSTPIPSVAAARDGKDNTPPASQDIVPIKQRLGTVTRLSAPLVRQPWFLAGQSVPLIALIGAIAWGKRKESLANNPRLRRQRQVAQIVRDGLNELRSSAASNDSDHFFATVFRLLQEQLGERLDLPASAITEAVIEERLRPKGVSDSILSGLHELFQLSNLARYAPIRSSQELTALIPKVEKVLLDLREVRV